MRNKRLFGFATSGGGQTSRTELYSTVLQNAANRAASIIYDRQLSGQITGLVIRNGRVDHAVGSHDDMVISLLLCHWVLTMGKNLIQYGIDPATIMMHAVRSVPQTSDEKLSNYLQMQIRTRCNDPLL